MPMTRRDAPHLAALLPAMRCRHCDAELLGPARRGGDGATCNACLDAITETAAGIRAIDRIPAASSTSTVGRSGRRRSRTPRRSW